MEQPEPTAHTIAFPSPLDIAAITLALLPFICNFSFSSSRTVNGQVVEETNIDIIPIIAGSIAVILGLRVGLMWLNHTVDDDRLKRGAVVIGAIAIGIFQVLVRGLDAI